MEKVKEKKQSNTSIVTSFCYNFYFTRYITFYIYKVLNSWVYANGSTCSMRHMDQNRRISRSFFDDPATGVLCQNATNIILQSTEFQKDLTVLRKMNEKAKSKYVKTQVFFFIFYFPFSNINEAGSITKPNLSCILASIHPQPKDSMPSPVSFRLVGKYKGMYL